MPTPSRLLYLLTDGGRARLMRRSSETGHYVTLEEIDGGPRLRALHSELQSSPPARSFASMSPAHSAVGKEDYYRPAKEAFVAEVADRAIDVARRENLEAVVLAAPARLVGPLTARLERRIEIGGIRKDLTKAPNDELGAWLMLRPFSEVGPEADRLSTLRLPSSGAIPNSRSTFSRAAA